MAVVGWYGAGWWGVSATSTADLARITADLLRAQALLEARVAELEAALEPSTEIGATWSTE